MQLQLPGHVQELLIRGCTTYTSLTMPHRDGGRVCVHTLTCSVGTAWQRCGVVWAHLCLCPTRSVLLAAPQTVWACYSPGSAPTCQLAAPAVLTSSTSSSITVSLSSALTGSWWMVSRWRGDNSCNCSVSLSLTGNLREALFWRWDLLGVTCDDPFIPLDAAVLNFSHISKGVSCSRDTICGSLMQRVSEGSQLVNCQPLTLCLC